MTFPNFEITTGLQLTPDGRDVQVLWPSDGSEWTAATVRALLWQIKGQWKFDLDRGVEYNRILGLPADVREVQEIFRREISKYVDLTELTVKIEQENVFVTWRGAGSSVTETISLLEPPAVDAPKLLAAKLRGDSEIVLQYDRQMNPARVPLPEDFEFTPPTPAIGAITINGTHVFMTLSVGLDGDTWMTYNPGLTGFQSLDRVDAAPFRVLILDSFALLGTEGGDQLITEGGDRLLAE